MQHLEVSGAVRHIYVIRRLKVKYTVPVNSLLYVTLSIDLHHVSCGHDT